VVADIFMLKKKHKEIN